MLSLNNDIMFHKQNVKVVSLEIAEEKYVIPRVFNFSFQCLYIYFIN